MSEEKDLVKDLVAQSKGVLEKAYDDMAHPTAKSLGNTVSFFPRTIGILLGKWEKWIINGEESIRLTAEAVREKASKIPEEKLIEPEPYVAVPAIQQLSYCYNSEELRDLYANLLVSAINSDTKAEVHPAFVDIIKQMSPSDARAIQRICKNSIPVPVITAMLTLKETKGLIELLVNYSFVLADIFQSTNDLCASLQNLERLGLIQVRYDQKLIDKSEYEPFYEDPIYLSEVERYRDLEKATLIEKKGLIQLTRFGRSFCSTCC